MGKNPSQREMLQPVFTQSYLAVPNTIISIHSSWTAGTFVLFLHYQSIYISRALLFSLKLTSPIITSREIRSRPETRQRSACFGFLHTFALKCVIQYFDTFFVWNFLRILIHFTLPTPLVTPPFTPISPISYSPNISGCPVLNYMYTASPSI